MKYRVEKLGQFETPVEESSPIDLDHYLAIARRQWRITLVCAFLTACLGFAYALTAVPVFTASASILIDTSKQKLADQLSSVTGVLEDDASILSQVEILKSDKVALAVSEKLDLKDDPVFMAQRAGLIRNVVSTVRALLNVSGWFREEIAPPDTDEQVQDKIAGSLQGSLRVTRVAGTYVLTVEYSSVDANLAAKIAKGYADAYLNDQLDSKYEATRRASDWLQQRIAELRQKALETDLAVQKFRAEKSLISSDGQLVSEQQLTQINSQLMLAQSDTASAEAKYNRIQSILKSRNLDAAVSESLSSTVITELRGKYLEASRKEAEISARLGPNHTQAVRLRGQMMEYQRLMFEELGRIAQSYQNTYEVAVGRQKSLEQQLAQATGVSATANNAQVQLRELEREADTYKRLYETFLQRFQESVQQQSFPVTEARVISNPKKPDRPSAPKKPLIVLGSIFIGLLLGAGIGAYREFRDRFFRTGEQVREVLELESIGTIPEHSQRSIFTKKPSAAPQSSVVNKMDPISNYVIDNPLSSFAETLRSAKIAVDVLLDSKRPKLVGVVSVMPGEGKSTISINLAELLASQGARVLLIDADLRNPGATRQLGRHAEHGILEALRDSVPAKDILLRNPETGLSFLPAVIKQRIPYSSELLASPSMDRLIRDFSDSFDYIIFDLPPLAAVVDARALASRLDTYLFVVEWGKTARSTVKRTLIENAVVARKCAGVILNKVHPKKMKFYQAYGAVDVSMSRFSKYYGE